MQVAKHFPRFPDLPPEIQLQIWESTGATLPSMHIFDVCVPSSPVSTGPNCASNQNQDHGPSKRDTIYLEEADDTLYLDTLNTELRHPETPTAITTQGAHFRANPSMYTFQDSLRAACIDSANTLQRTTTARKEDLNTIHLPGGRAITYHNAQDVLHLRFVPPAFRFPGGGRLAGPVSAAFEGIWSGALASALHRARRVAIDVSQLWPDLGRARGDLLQDVAYLACVLQNDLEVLYLVDYCAGRCSNGGVGVGGLVGSRDGGLYRKVFGFGGGDVGDAEEEAAWDKESRREPDVFHGVGKIWREVFELEKLGWGERHPGFVFAEAFSEVVRMQQGNYMGDDEGAVRKEVSFKGIRVLIAEDEEAAGLDSSMALSCGCGRQTSSHKDV